MTLDPTYLTDTATWRVPGGPVEGSLYDESEPTDTEVRVRWENRRRMVRDASGSETVSEALLFCLVPVRSGHVLIDGEGKEWPVVQAAEQKGLDGRYSHTEVSL